VIKMPGGDGTGPMGLGSMTGRAAGYCAGYPVPGYMNPVPGRGYSGRGYFGWGRGMGRGGGRGRRNWYYTTGLTGWQRAAQGLPAWGGGGAYPYYGAPYAAAPYANPYNPWGAEITPQQEADMLREQARAMQEEINSINQRITELESATKTKKS
jgi:hypothetical protein